MKDIIPPVPVEQLEKELTEDKLWRRTNKLKNLIYSFSAEDSPALMREVGRLRELSFRAAGGGTGNEIDIDELDTAEDGYRQMIVWNPVDRDIIGGYRYIVSDSTHPKNLSTEHYFDFSDNFRENYLPWTVELGRSFIQPKYQFRQNIKSLFALDNLWDGIVTIFMRNPRLRYCFGKITMYGDYNRIARDYILYFLKKHFHDTENLMTSRFPVTLCMDEQKLSEIFTGKNYKADYRILKRVTRDLGVGIPPLFNAYMNLSPTMKVFDTALNSDFGDVEETGILITISDIYKEKFDRHCKY